MHGDMDRNKRYIRLNLEVRELNEETEHIISNDSFGLALFFCS